MSDTSQDTGRDTENFSDKTEKNIRSARDIKKSLLKKAISEGRGHEMIKLILWRLAHVKHEAAKDEQAIDEARYMSDQPQSVRALNTLAFHRDSSRRFSVSEEALTDGRIHEAPQSIH